MKVITQSAVIPKAPYVHLAYLSAGLEMYDPVKVLLLVVGMAVAWLYLLSKLFKRLL